jgi:uncharacterized membrane protein
MEAWLREAAHQVALALQGLAIAVVAIGTAAAVVDAVRVALLARRDEEERRVVWLRYARWLVAALTFQLAADIVGTSMAPTWDDVGRLGAVAAIRTFLSYFLDHEMERTRRLQQMSARADACAGGAPGRG